MRKKLKKSPMTANHRNPWTGRDRKELRAHSKARTPLTEISQIMGRTPGALRMMAHKLEISIGHYNR